MKFMSLALVRNIVSPTGCCALFICVVLLLGSGCGALRRAQMSSVAGILAGPPESNVFARDDDPELIRDALPFALKTFEALLASDPKNRDLLLATAETFVMYANAFIHTDAEKEEEVDFKRARYFRQRATRQILNMFYLLCRQKMCPCFIGLRRVGGAPFPLTWATCLSWRNFPL
jgi:hypothetical protein